MHAARPALAASALFSAVLALAGCSGDRFTGFDLPGTSSAPAVEPPPPAAPAPPPINLAGRWLMASPGRGQCNVMLSATAADAASGNVAPEGGCPGKLFTSRKWT